jgi:hypothetical protein
LYKIDPQKESKEPIRNILFYNGISCMILAHKRASGGGAAMNNGAALNDDGPAGPPPNALAYYDPQLGMMIQ